MPLHCFYQQHKRLSTYHISEGPVTRSVKTYIARHKASVVNSCMISRPSWINAITVGESPTTHSRCRRTPFTTACQWSACPPNNEDQYPLPPFAVYATRRLLFQRPEWKHSPAMRALRVSSIGDGRPYVWYSANANDSRAAHSSNEA